MARCPICKRPPNDITLSPGQAPCNCQPTPVAAPADRATDVTSVTPADQLRMERNAADLKRLREQNKSTEPHKFDTSKVIYDGRSIRVKDEAALKEKAQKLCDHQFKYWGECVHCEPAQPENQQVSDLSSEESGNFRTAPREWEQPLQRVDLEPPKSGDSVLCECGRSYLVARYPEGHCNEGKLKSALDAALAKKCERCGDMFYHPKTMIEDAKQHAAEWEDTARRFLRERDAAQAEVERLREMTFNLVSCFGSIGDDQQIPVSKNPMSFREIRDAVGSWQKERDALQAKYDALKGDRDKFLATDDCYYWTPEAQKERDGLREKCERFQLEIERLKNEK